MQMKDIIERMNKDYGLNPDRRTIYGALALLLDMGYDISVYEENGKGYSQTYLKSLHNQLSAIFNHAVKYYELKNNPAVKAGNMGKKESEKE